MRTRIYILFLFFTLLFLFYPGNSEYFRVIALNRNRFFKHQNYTTKITLEPVPVTNGAVYPPISAYATYVVDAPTFTPILSFNPHEKLYPASTTKIITALVAMEVMKPEDVVSINRVKDEGQTMGLVVGEKITLENLLYGLLVHSGNDAAYAIADAVGYDKFIDLMNKKAAELKMNGTHFVNPAGLDDANQYSTAFDLAIASRELLTNPLLKKIVGTKEIIISDIDYQIFHKLSNVNKLLGEIQGIGGLKTGYTENAGENLVSLYKKDGHEYIIVILKSQDRFADTRLIVDWLKTNVSYSTPQWE